MSNQRSEFNDPMYREYINMINEEGKLEALERRKIENEIFEEEEKFELIKEERIVETEGFNPINDEVLIDNGLVSNSVNSFEKELELEEDMDIIQEDKEFGW